ncbi:hypothetical protein MtrunA17_Chr4g0032841 [Medicago truncatula]|uniref:Uncharacterized protein n=1 Tax=Medicago truncatula TaxID=3880 RepID=G7JCI4_MEDTR|nr:hypothetical protein MTR_4g065180 [Medicago truncatula]RHN61087.1 hypothetical protein MtrunA17_Chr4g0032841 [Medicago truncatula]
MELSLLDGDEDAYRWILTTEQYFRATRKSEVAKMMVVDLTMRGPALRWWLWCFKPEWRHLLPILDEEMEPTSESHTNFHFTILSHPHYAGSG